ncbi:MAG: ABC transporter permease [Spirochaetaceae bacterium]|jgi:ribose transport system permease protein|nr:ABC transporter permease [Spirochaetaceae bacterium]
MNISAADAVKKILKIKILTIAAILLMLIIIAAVVSPNFLTAYNLQSVVRDLSFVMIITVGQSCLLMLGELDLSVGKMASLSGVIGGILMLHGQIPPYLALLISLLCGILLGVTNGLLITKLRLNAMIVTIATQGVFAGITLVITKGRAIVGIPEQIHYLGRGMLFGIPVPFIIACTLLLVVLFITQKTRFGRYIYAIGNNREAAKILGINVDAVRITVYAMMGFLCAIAGLLMIARLGNSQPAIGDIWVMNSIAASVIGGVALTGGVGNPLGAVLGACILSVIQNMIVLFNVNTYWQTAVSGIVVLIAISIDSVSVIANDMLARAASSKRLVKKPSDQESSVV